MNFKPFVLFNTDDPAAATPPAPAAPEPVAAAPAPAPVQPTPAGDGPWAADLAALFPDDQVRGQVDQFLRAKVQPHVTRVETEFAPARELWTDLQGDDSISTYVAIAQQLYGDEVAQNVAQTLQAQANAAQQPEPATPPAQLPPEDKQAIDWARAQQAEQLYQSELARVKAAAPDTDINDELFARFVVGSEGDFDAALADYQRLAPTLAAAPPAPEPTAPTAPATLDAGGSPAVPAPTVPGRQTFDQAIEDTLAEMRANRAPATVGQV